MMTENLNISGEQERKELDCAESERAERKEIRIFKRIVAVGGVAFGRAAHIQRNDRIERKAGLLVAFSVWRLSVIYIPIALK